MAGQHTLKKMHRPIGRAPAPGTGLEHANVIIEGTAPEDTPQQKAASIAEALQATGAGKRREINRLRDSIEEYADTLYIMNLGDTVAKIGQFYSSNLIRITSIFINTPIASTSVTLVLGQRQIPLPSGYVPISPMSAIHRPEDPIILTVAPALANTAFIWVQGQQLPEVNF